MDAKVPVRPHEAQLWLFDLRVAPPDLAALTAVLDNDEMARAERFRFAEDRTAFIVAHGRLRQLLGSWLDRAPAEVRLLQPAGEKPVVADVEGAHFSLSHSGSIGMVGLATTPIGVDVETVRALSDRDAIVARYFARAEVRALLTLPERARQQAFFACWTRKEAFVKAIGIGLAAPLDGFEVSVDEPARLCTVAGRAGEARRWSLWSSRLGEVAHAAAAARDQRMSYALFDHRADARTAACTS